MFSHLSVRMLVYYSARETKNEQTRRGAGKTTKWLRMGRKKRKKTKVVKMGEMMEVEKRERKKRKKTSRQGKLAKISISTFVLIVVESWWETIGTSCKPRGSTCVRYSVRMGWRERGRRADGR